MKKSVSIGKYQRAITNQLEDRVTFMEGISNEQKACKEMLRTTVEDTRQLTQWMKNIGGKCFH